MKSISGKTFVRVLKRHGWTRVKTKSSHQKYRSPNGMRTIVVPVHGNEDLKTGLLLKLMEQAGLREEDF